MSCFPLCWTTAQNSTKKKTTTKTTKTEQRPLEDSSEGEEVVERCEAANHVED